MVDFIFDLQRFATTSATTWDKFKEALADPTVTVIEYIPNEDTATESLTIDDTKTVTISTTGTLDMGAYSIESAGTLKISSSTITGTEGTTFLNITGGTTDITGTAVLTGNIEVSGGGEFTVSTGTLKLSGNISVVTGDLTVRKDTTVTGDVTLNSPANSGVTISGATLTVTGTYSSKNTTLQNSGKLVVNLSISDFYLYDSTSDTITNKNSATPITVTREGTDTTISGLVTGATFTINDVVYTVVSDNLITATDENDTTKIYEGSIAAGVTEAAISFTGSESELKPAIMVDATKALTLDDTAISSLTEDGTKIYSTDFQTTYGTISKDSSGVISITKIDATDAGSLTALNVIDGKTVSLSKNFTDVVITIIDGTSFKATATGDYTVTGSDKIATLAGAVAASVGTAGSLLTAASTTTLISNDGTYSVTGYTDSTGGNDGVLLTGKELSDIDVGESFTVGTQGYTMTSAGIMSSDLNSIYSGATLKGYGNGVGVDLASLTAANMAQIITPSSKVLTIGGTNSVSGVVFNEAKTANLYATLTASSGYTLDSLTGFTTNTFTGAVSTISVAKGAKASIGAAFADSTGAITYVNERTSTTFKVTAIKSGASYFVIDGTTDKRSVTNATEITLLSGSLYVNNTQTITLGSTGTTFKLDDGANIVQIVYDETAGTYSVEAAAGITFTFTDSTSTATTYEITATGTDGVVTFSVDSTGAVTFSDLDSGDIFTAGTTTYTVTSSALVKTETESESVSVWNVDGEHTVTGGTVTAASLDSDTNWSGVALVDDDKNLNLSTLTPNDTYTAINNTYDTIYGGVTVSSGAYTVAADATNTLTSVSLGSDATFVGASLESVAVNSEAATLTVIDDGTDSAFTVVTTADNASVSTGETVTLSGGTLAFSADTSVNVSDNNIEAAEGDFVVDTTNLTLTSGKKFSLDSSAEFRNTDIGLVNSTDTLYVLGSQDSITGLASLTASTIAMANANALTISADTKDALIVDDVTVPATAYAVYDSTTGVLGATNAESLPTLTAWDSVNNVYIDSTTVSLDGAVTLAPVVGLASSASVKVTSLAADNTGFNFTDTGTGATTNAATFDQYAGLVSLTSDTTQTVIAGTGTPHSISAVQDVTNGITVTISGTEEIIGGLEEKEVVNIDGTNYTVTAAGFVSDDSILVSDNIATLSADNLTGAQGYVTISGGAITLPTDTVPAIVLSDDLQTVYGNVATISGGYSLDTINATGDYYSSVTADTAVSAVAFGEGFDSVTITAAKSEAVFFVKEDSAFTLNNNTAASLTGDSLTIYQSAGAIELANTTQTINANGSVIAVAGTTDVTINVDDTEATIGGLDNSNEQIIVGDTAYTVKGDHLIREGSKLLIIGDDDAVAVSELGGNKWMSYVTLSAVNGTVSIPPSTESSPWIVTDQNVESHYATIQSADGDKYNVSLESTAAGQINIYGKNSGATFTTDDQDFTVEDKATGAVISNIDNVVSLTAGQVNLTTINKPTIHAGTNDMYYVSGNNGIKVSVDTDNNITFSGLDEDEVFSYADTNYTVTAAGLVSDTKILTGVTASVGSVAAASLGKGDKYTTITGGIVTINGSEGVVVESDFTASYASLTANGVNSLENATATPTGIYVAITEEAAIKNMANVSVTAASSGAKFTTDDDDYSVTDAATGAHIADATEVSLKTGVLSLEGGDSQTVTAGTYSVSAVGTSTKVTLSVSGSDATVGGLDTPDEVIYVNGSNYTVKGIGLMNETSLLTADEIKEDAAVDLAKVTDTTTGWAAVDTVNNTNSNYVTLGNAELIADSAYSALLATISTSSDSAYEVTAEDSAEFGYYATQSGAKFTTDDKEFKVTDASDGATFTDLDKAISLTAGVVSISGGATVNVGGTDIISSSDIVIDATNTTIGDLDDGEIFSYNGINYTVTAAGLVGGDKILRDVATSKTVAITDLGTAGDDYITVDSANAVVTIDGSKSGVIIDGTKFATLYGSLSADAINTIANGTGTLAGIYVSNSVKNAFGINNMASAEVTLQTSGAVFKTTDTAYTVTDNANGAYVKDADAITLSAGVVSVDSSTKIVNAASNNIAMTEGNATISASTTDATIGGLSTGEIVNIASADYSVKGIGLMKDESLLTADALDDNAVAVSKVTLTTSGWAKVDTVASDSADKYVTLSSDYTRIADSAYSTLYATVSTNGDAYTIIEDTNHAYGYAATNSSVQFSTDDTSFTVTDNADGATFEEVDEGAVSLASGKVSLGNNDKTTLSLENGEITYGTKGTDGIVVEATAKGKKATISGLGEIGETFTYGDTTYTVTAAGLVGGDKILLDVATSQTVDVESLGSGASLVTVGTDEVVTIDGSTTGVIIDGTKFATLYGTLSANAIDTIANGTGSLKGIYVSADTASINNMANVAVTADKSDAKFTTDDTAYTVTDADTGAYIAGAENVSLTAGTVSLNSDNAQTISSGDYKVDILEKATSGRSEATLTTDGNAVTIGGIDTGEVFHAADINNNLDGTYTLKGVGLMDGTSLLTSGGFSNGAVAVADLFGDNWSATDTIDNLSTSYLTLAGAKEGEAPTLIVDTKYASVLATVGATANDAYGVTIGGDAKFNGYHATLSGAKFTTDDKAFGVTDSVDGATFTDMDEGVVSLESGNVSLGGTDTITTIHANEKDLVNVSGNGISLTAEGSKVTIGALDGNDVFNFGGVSYTVTAAGLVSSDKILLGVESVSGTVDAASLGSGYNYITVDSAAAALTIAGTATTKGDSPWVVVSSDFKTTYGTLAADGSGYVFDTIAADNASLTTVLIDDKGSPVTLNNVAAAGISATLSGATFTLIDDADGKVVVTDNANGAYITETSQISLTAGTVSLNNTNAQTITAANNNKIAMTDGDATLYAEGKDATIGALETDDMFNVAGISYTVEKIGLMNKDSLLIFDNLQDSAVAVSTIVATDGWVLTDTVGTDNKVTLSAAERLVNAGYSAILATVASDGTAYTVTANTDLTYNVTNSGAQFTTGSLSFTVNDVAEGASISATNVTLTAGIETLSYDNPQTVYAGTAEGENVQHSISAVNGGVAVTISGTEEIIQGLEEKEVVNVDGTNYTVTAAGFVSDKTVLISKETATLSADSLGSASSYITITDGAITLPSSIVPAVVLSNDLATIYGNVNTISGGYSLDTLNATGGFSAVTAAGISAVAFGAGFDSVTITAAKSEAVFYVGESAAFTLNNNDAASLTGENLTIYQSAGAIELANTTQTISANESVIAVAGTNPDVTVNVDGTEATIGGLDNSDEQIIVNDTTYTVKGNNLIKDDNKLLIIGDDNAVAVSELGGNKWMSMITLSSETSNVTIPPSDGTTPWVVTDSTGEINYGTIKGDDTSGYNVSVADGGKFGIYATASGAQFTTDDKDFTVKDAEGGAVITGIESDVVTLTGGKVSLASATPTIYAAQNNINFVSGDGVVVEASGNKATIGALDSTEKDVFSYGGTNYTITAAGLVSDSLIWTTVASADGTITSTDLKAGDKYTTISSGIVTIDGSEGVVVGSDFKAKYATLTANSVDTIANGTTPTGIYVSIDGAAAINGMSGVSVTADKSGAVFTVNYDAYSVTDANTGAYIADATEVNLTAGVLSLQGVDNQTIAAGKIYTVSAVGATTEVTLSVDNNKVTVGDLDKKGESFNVTTSDGTTTYTIFGDKLFVMDEDGKAEAQVTNFSESALTLGDDELTSIIAPTDDALLDLSTLAANTYLVYSDASSPTDNLGSVTISSTAVTFDAEDTVKAADAIASISLASKVSNASIDFVTDVMTNSLKEIKINGEDYTAATAGITVTSDGTASKLKDGTVVLAATKDVVIDATVTAVTGDITVSAADSKFASVSGVDAGEAFKVDTTEYQNSNIGLVKGGASILLGEATEFTAATLTGDDFTTIVTVTSGALTIDGTAAGVVADISNLKDAKNYGSLASDVFTAGTDTLTSITVDGVVATLPANDATLSADGATFTVTDTDTFAVDASSEVATVKSADTVNLTDGALFSDGTIVAGGYSIVGADVAVSVNGTAVSVTDIANGESFTVDATTYKMINGNLFVMEDDKAIAQVGDSFSEGTLTLGEDDTTDIIAPTEGALDLSTLAADTYLVYSDASSPTGNLGSVTIDSAAVTFTTATGATPATDIATISLADTVTNASIDFETFVTTDSTEAITVNTQDYDATEKGLTVKTTAESSTLYNGTVALAATKDVVISDATIAATTGTINAAAANGSLSAVSDVDAGEVFKVDTTEYQKSNIGLVKGGASILLGSASTFTAATLAGDDFTTIVTVTSGALTIDTTTADGVVADISNLKDAKNYGTIASDVFTASENATLTSVTVAGTAATISGTIDPTFSAVDATFTVTEDNNKSFAVDANGTIASVTAADEISLTDGALFSDGTIVAGSYTIVGESVAVDVDGSAVSVTDIDNGESFTIGSDVYTRSGDYLINTTDGTQVVKGYADGVLTLDDKAENAILAPSAGVLDLDQDDATYAVFDSVSKPTTKLAEVTIAKGVIGLSSVEGASAITTVEVNTKTTELTTDFATNIVTEADAVTVNSVAFAPSGAVTIAADEESAALFAGNVVLEGGASVIGSESGTVIAGESSDMVVTAVDGTLTVVDGLEAGESFTYNGETYTQSDFGLMNSAGEVDTVFAGASSITLSKLDDFAGVEYVAPEDGILDLTGITGTSVIVLDDKTTPKQQIATVTVTDGAIKLATYNAFTGEISEYITNVNVSEDATITTDFATKVTGAGELTVNTVAYNAADEVVISAAEDGKTSTLYNGAVTLDGETYTTVTDSSENANTVSVTTASKGIVVTAADGTITTLSGVATEDVFTYNDTEYTQSDCGLTTEEDGKNYIYTEFKSTITVADLAEAEGTLYIAPTDGVIAAADVTENVAVYDALTVPTTQRGNITVDGSDYTVDFAIDLTVESGKTVTINDTVYEATSDITVSTTADASTLTLGSVTVSEGNTVTTTNDDVVTTTTGTITLTVDEDGAATISEIAEEGDTFTVNGVEYTMTAIGLRRGSDNYLWNTSYEDGIAVSDLTVVDYWTATLVGGTSILGISSGTLEPGTDCALVDDKDNPTVIYGRLSRDSAGVYTIDAENESVSKPAGISLTDADIKLASDYAELPLQVTAGDETATLTVTADSDYTVNASGSAAIGLEGVASVGVEGTAPISIGEETVTVTGDTSYGIDVTDDDITSLNEISNATIAGLVNGTINTDEEGTVTVDKTYTANVGTAYTVEDSTIVAASGVETISGDFSDGLNVNGDDYTVDGGEVTIDDEGNIAAAAGDYTVNGAEIGTTADMTVATADGEIAGISTAGEATITLGQSATALDINGDTITTDNAIELGVDENGVSEVNGLSGMISGLDDAVVNDVSEGTINGSAISILGDEDGVDVVVAGTSAISASGLSNGATVVSAEGMSLATDGDGVFTFGDEVYSIDSADDTGATFTTDDSSDVDNISMSGTVETTDDDIALNGKEVEMSNPDGMAITTDGEEITAISGLSANQSVGGDIENATVELPEGTATVDGVEYTLSEDGASLVGENNLVMPEDAMVTIGTADDYTINGEAVTAEEDNQVFAINEDGVYTPDGNDMPIRETTPAAQIFGDETNTVHSTEDGEEIVLEGNKALALIEGDAAVTNGGGLGDSVVVRNDADVTLDVANGTTTVVPVSGTVELENYDDDTTAIKTYKYNDIANAVKNDKIKFGDGNMTLSDGGAEVTFDADATEEGFTVATLIDAEGDKQKVGFTHTDGGMIDVSAEDEDYVLKGNYAETTNDTQKSSGSTLTGGSGNDTLLIGEGDVAEAGGGTNEVYITPEALRDEAATVVAGTTEGVTEVHNFSTGYDKENDVVELSNVNSLEFTAGASGVSMGTGDASVVFAGIEPTDAVINSSNPLNADGGYELKLSYGDETYKAAVAQAGKGLAVTDENEADAFFAEALSFIEYTDDVVVDLNNNAANIGGNDAYLSGVTAVEGGAVSSTLIGADDVENTLIAGSGGGLIMSGKGNDVLVGNTDSDKTAGTAFYHAAGYGKDTISNFDFMTSSGDDISDSIVISPSNSVTSVTIKDNDVLIGFNNSAADVLTVEDAVGEHMAVNGVIAQVAKELEYDGYTTCYVGNGKNSTVNVGSDMGDVFINMGAEEGTTYINGIVALDASEANGNNTLVGNENDNLIIGGTGSNSLFGGYGNTNDTLTGGEGYNAFFFDVQNGTDRITDLNDGDDINIMVGLDQISTTNITSSGVTIELTDGSKLNVSGDEDVTYNLNDGTSYKANHETKEWDQQ
ncbi:MAG: hypothetical protein K6G55_08810 [Selenomonadaceae bacterium]|nr:hypothetical protein [Selenomonadaceae bacterium]